MVNTKSQNIPNSLKRYRKARGLKQKDVAMILELNNTSMISRWEKGIFLPNTINIFKLAIIYRTMADALFPDLLKALKSDIQKREDQVVKCKR
jgi:transcriptional regulator with XRE-family HTH domain